MDPKFLKRMLVIEHKIDNLESRIVPLLGARKDKIDYWMNARTVGRGRLLELYLK
jgi:hypothetical protein